MQKWLTVTGVALVAGYCYSMQAHALMCPKSYTQIRVGMSEASVRSACGKPASAKTSKQVGYSDKIVEYWRYSSKQAVGYVGERSPEITVVIDHNKKVKSISVGGNGTSHTTACGSDFSVGSSSQRVASSCGSPDSVGRGKARVQTGLVTVTEMTYKFDKYSPTVRLIFHNGVLQSIQ